MLSGKFMRIWQVFLLVAACLAIPATVGSGRTFTIDTASTPPIMRISVGDPNIPDVNSVGTFAGDVVVFNVASLEILNTDTVTVVPGTRAVPAKAMHIIAEGNISIDAVIDFSGGAGFYNSTSATQYTDGQLGGYDGAPLRASLPLNGGPGMGSGNRQGGGGGGHAGKGGDASCFVAGINTSGWGGPANGIPQLYQLVGGSGGAGGERAGGGAGGGAIGLTSLNGNITIGSSGAIIAKGGAGAEYYVSSGDMGNAGGGAGGAIRLAAGSGTVTVDGLLSAMGGKGGDRPYYAGPPARTDYRRACGGGGGGGYVAIYSAAGSWGGSGTISVAGGLGGVVTGLPTDTTGFLFADAQAGGSGVITTVAGPMPPVAGNPVPVYATTKVSILTGLAWEKAGLDQVVKFGTSSTLTDDDIILVDSTGVEAIANAQLGGPLAENTTYYWKVITGGFEAPAFLWHFTTGSATAYQPSPADGAQEIDPVGVNLTWQVDEPGVVSYDVYFSTDAAAVANGTAPKTTVTSKSSPTGALVKGITYYWRVDTNYDTWQKTGNVWKLRAVSFKVQINTDGIPKYSIDGAPDVNGVVDTGNIAVFVFNQFEFDGPGQWDVVVTGSRGVAIWSEGDLKFNGILDVSAPFTPMQNSAIPGIAGAYEGGSRGVAADPNINGPGHGYRSPDYVGGGGGAGYGGLGGRSGRNEVLRGAIYGEPELYTLWGGSGGSSGTYYAGGSGGGIVELYAKGNLEIGALAQIRSRGGSVGQADARPGGGGSGGSIRLVSEGNATVAGLLSVDGGNGGNTENAAAEVAGGGAGGRIALYAGGTLSATGQLSVTGGDPGILAATGETAGQPGEDGTVFSGVAQVLRSAQSPVPADKAFGFNATVGFDPNDPNETTVWPSFVPGFGATACTVYFGTDPGSLVEYATYTAPGAYEPNATELADPNFAMPPSVDYLRGRQDVVIDLEGGTYYYWKVESQIGGNSYSSPVWKFRTLGNETRNPTPAFGAVDAPIPAALHWDAGQPSLATKWDVYVGESEDTLVFLQDMVADPNGAFPVLNDLDATKTYYWRVDEYVGAAKTTGNVWRFTTRGPICATGAPGDLNSDCYVDFKDFALMAQSWGVCNLVPASSCD